jgi:hypothetical protein
MAAEQGLLESDLIRAVELLADTFAIPSESPRQKA